MWADTLLRAEQQHALSLMFWAAASILAGTALFATLAIKGGRSPLLRQFGFQMLGWGVVEVVLGGLSWHGLALRDVAGAARLERMLWLAVGLEIGVVAAGTTLASTAWLVGRRIGGVGAGIGIAVQGLALLVLDLRLISVVSR